MNTFLQTLFFVTILIISFAYWGTYFLATILAISCLIIFHEFGHFIVARALKVKVNVFSLGFGSSIYEKEIGGTKYRLSAIWLGGYVQLKGQDDMKPELKNYDADSYNTLKPIERIAISVAGPLFNLILAFVLYVAVGVLGVEKLAAVVGNIMPNSAAAQAGLQKGDKILQINGVNISHWDEIKPLVTLNPTTIVYQRNAITHQTTLNPKIGESKTIFGEPIKTPLIGITPNPNEITTIYYKGFSSITYAINETWQASKLIYQSIEKLITGVVPITKLGGIVAMADITTKAATISLATFFIITALISVNLGLLNLLPLPVLDGGHIAFNLYEMIFKKQAGENFFVWTSYASMALLFILMAFTIINDIYRLVSGSGY